MSHGAVCRPGTRELLAPSDMHPRGGGGAGGRVLTWRERVGRERHHLALLHQRLLGLLVALQQAGVRGAWGGLAMWWDERRLACTSCTPGSLQRSSGMHLLPTFANTCRQPALCGAHGDGCRLTQADPALWALRAAPTCAMSSALPWSAVTMKRPFTSSTTSSSSCGGGEVGVEDE